jgi:hypothetical protein
LLIVMLDDFGLVSQIPFAAKMQTIAVKAFISQVSIVQLAKLVRTNSSPTLERVCKVGQFRITQPPGNLRKWHSAIS